MNAFGELSGSRKQLCGFVLQVSSSYCMVPGFSLLMFYLSSLAIGFMAQKSGTMLKTLSKMLAFWGYCIGLSFCLDTV